MESESDRRLDANIAGRLLLEMAQERSLDLLLAKLVQRAFERPDVACLQVWLIDKGDRCATCPRRVVCADQTRCLHLVAGIGKTVSGEVSQAPYFNDLNQRVPLGPQLFWSHTGR